MREKRPANVWRGSTTYFFFFSFQTFIDNTAYRLVRLELVLVNGFSDWVIIIWPAADFFPPDPFKTKITTDFASVASVWWRGKKKKKYRTILKTIEGRRRRLLNWSPERCRFHRVVLILLPVVVHGWVGCFGFFSILFFCCCVDPSHSHQVNLGWWHAKPKVMETSSIPNQVWISSFGSSCCYVVLTAVF